MKWPMYTSRSGAITRSCAASASARLRAGEQLRTRGLGCARRGRRSSVPCAEPPMRMPTSSSTSRTPATAYAASPVPSAVVDGAAGEHERPGGEAAPHRPAEHADLDAAVDIAEQRDRAGRDRRDGRCRSSRMVWARRPSTAPACERDTMRVRCHPISKSRSSSPTLPIRSRRHASGARPARRHQVRTARR